MGLDMYLTKRTYVKNWDFMKPEEKHEVSVKLAGKVHPEIKPERVSVIVENVGYWRKANHIHRWFVEHVQDGKDDCEEYLVTRENLIDLLESCEAVLSSRVDAKNLLPTQQGFFFGGTDYDEYYFKDIEDTIAIVKDCLASEKGNFYYQSSW